MDLFLIDFVDDVIPGGCTEAVLHVPAVVFVIIVLIPTDAG